MSPSMIWPEAALTAPTPAAPNEKQQKLAHAEVCVAAAGWLSMLEPVGPPPRLGTLPGAPLPGKNRVFWEGCSQAGMGFPLPSGSALTLPSRGGGQGVTKGLGMLARPGLCCALNAGARWCGKAFSSREAFAFAI